MQITFTDAEQRFADSPEGSAAIARARMTFDLRNAHKGSQAPQWTDAMEANTIRELTTKTARGAVERSAMMADCARQEPIARAAAETARAQMIADMQARRR